MILTSGHLVLYVVLLCALVVARWLQSVLALKEARKTETITATPQAAVEILKFKRRTSNLRDTLQVLTVLQVIAQQTSHNLAEMTNSSPTFLHIERQNAVLGSLCEDFTAIKQQVKHQQHVILQHVQQLDSLYSLMRDYRHLKQRAAFRFKLQAVLLTKACSLQCKGWRTLMFYR